jgi:hypothetical protein
MGPVRTAACATAQGNPHETVFSISWQSDGGRA